MSKPLPTTFPGAPEQLRRVGLQGATDNAEGKVVKLPKGMLWHFFGDELQARFLRPGGKG